eukprot:6674354-Pyramimonas_sp.AAC.1
MRYICSVHPCCCCCCCCCGRQAPWATEDAAMRCVTLWRSALCLQQRRAGSDGTAPRAMWAPCAPPCLAGARG